MKDIMFWNQLLPYLLRNLSQMNWGLQSSYQSFDDSLYVRTVFPDSLKSPWLSRRSFIKAFSAESVYSSVYQTDMDYD